MQRLTVIHFVFIDDVMGDHDIAFTPRLEVGHAQRAGDARRQRTDLAHQVGLGCERPVFLREDGALVQGAFPDGLVAKGNRVDQLLRLRLDRW